MREFDLNIEKVLENWNVAYALREIIANALDEQILTNTAEINIFQDNGTWHIRDYGRGLQYIHLTQNENEEKLAHPGLIGKFGVGLKDALATFDRHNINVVIDSRFGHITIGKSKKHGFTDITTLHAYIGEPLDKDYIGTDFAIQGCSEQDIECAKNFFLVFSNLSRYETTPYGEVYAKRNNISEIFINGVKVAEEENFLFSYNITSINATLRKAINRERTNVGRSAYSERVRSILLNVHSDKVISEFTENLTNMSAGRQCDEMKWVDVQTYAVQLLNAQKNTVFVTPNEIKSSGGSVLEIVKESGKTPVFIPETVKKKIEGANDTNGNKIQTIETVIQQYNDSFEYTFIPYDKLTPEEKRNYDLIPTVLTLLNSKMPAERIFISETLKKDLSDTTLGLYEHPEHRIIILRKQLSSRKDFLGTLIHELTHESSGFGDVSRGFEHALTLITGAFADQIIQLQSDLKETEKAHALKVVYPETDNPKVDLSLISQMNVSELEKMGSEVNASDGILIYQELLKRNPKSAEYHYELALRYRITNNYDSALVEIDKALCIDNTSGKYHVEKGSIYYKQEVFSSALSEVEQAKKYDYVSENLYIVEGGVYFHQENHEKAHQIFQEAICKYPNNEEFSHDLLCVIIGYEKDYDKAIEVADQMIANQPENAVLYYAKATALIYKYRFDEAYDAAKRATELNPGEVKYHQILGVAGSMKTGGFSLSL